MKYFIYCRKSTDAEERQVLSIESQLSEATKLVAGTHGLEVVKIYEEAQSARKPGRPIFDEMLQRIEKGHAEGIISWHPDRLARNSVDGGRIIHLLDTGSLKDLRFASHTFENNPQGKLMLSMLFGFSKYYVDSLAENVRRGNRTKAEKGWRPSKPPLGYITDQATRTAIPDPERFDLVQQIFQLMLTGAYPPRRLLEKATNEWGLRSRRRPKGGGTPLHLSSIYAMLKNPFYAGVFRWEGTIHKGKHQAMIGLAEFEKIQALLGRSTSPRPQHRVFAFTGAIRCGACGLAVTAEHKRNRYGYQYIYYHCTRRRRDNYCREKCITADALEREIIDFLDSLRIAGWSRGWLEAAFPHRDAEAVTDRKVQRESVVASISALDREMGVLTELRIRELITDEEFLERRNGLSMRRLTLTQNLARIREPSEWIEPLDLFGSFCNRAVECFLRGDPIQKRLILETVGSNLRLRDGKLSIEARKPFVQRGRNACNSQLCAVEDSNL
ncbi:MAG: recombinase family protein [Minisyncoccota bacterium]